MNELIFYSPDPRALEKEGFTYREEEFDGPNGHAWLDRRLSTAKSQVDFTIQIEFELDVDGTGKTFSFNGVYLVVTDRQMERLDSDGFDEKTESPRQIDRWPLPCRTLEEIQQLCRLLGKGF